MPQTETLDLTNGGIARLSTVTFLFINWFAPALYLGSKVETFVTICQMRDAFDISSNPLSSASYASEAPRSSWNWRFIVFRLVSSCRRYREPVIATVALDHIAHRGGLKVSSPTIETAENKRNT